jgi:hypothetical protein
VAANVLATVERQLSLGDVQERRFRAGLESLGVTSAGELADCIARGDYDRLEKELWGFLATSVRDRLAVANPKHLLR